MKTYFEEKKFERTYNYEKFKKYMINGQKQINQRI